MKHPKNAPLDFDANMRHNSAWNRRVHRNHMMNRFFSRVGPFLLFFVAAVTIVWFVVTLWSAA